MFRRLTTEEYFRVELATRRESYTHRHWPPDVVRAVAAADVVAAEPTYRNAAWSKVSSMGIRLFRFRNRGAGADGIAATT